MGGINDAAKTVSRLFVRIFDFFYLKVFCKYILPRKRLLNVIDFIRFYIYYSLNFTIGYICKTIIVDYRKKEIKLKRLLGLLFGFRTVIIGEPVVKKLVEYMSLNHFDYEILLDRKSVV